VFAEDLDLSDKSTSGTDRVLISGLGLRVFARHPFFGVGPKAYESYMWYRFDAENPGASKRDAGGGVIAKNENIWIEWLAECGVFFTVLWAAILVRALWVPGWTFRNPVQFGAWIALVMYFALSGQVSQNGLLTMVYAVAGIYFRARELPRVAESTAFIPARRPPPIDSRAPLSSNTRPRA
jgi:O-antigen ligase